MGFGFGQRKGGLPLLFLNQSMLCCILGRWTRRFMSLFLPGKEIRREPSRIVSRPWPGRKSMIIPAKRRIIPKMLRNIAKIIEPIEWGVVCLSFCCNVRKQSCGSFPTPHGISIKLRKKVKTESIASHPNRGCKRSELTKDSVKVLILWTNEPALKVQ